MLLITSKIYSYTLFTTLRLSIREMVVMGAQGLSCNLRGYSISTLINYSIISLCSDYSL